MSRLDALVVREGKDGRKHWAKIGAAFPNDRGGYNIVFDALPIDGKVFLYPPRERSPQQAPAAQGGGYSDAEYGAGKGDDLPF